MRAAATGGQAGGQNRQISRFRERRGKRLTRLIDGIAGAQQRPVTILDLGGSRDYWGNVSIDNVSQIILLNKYDFEFVDNNKVLYGEINFENRQGDATCLAEFDDKSIDLVHSNSVIEHVGSWSNIKAFAEEATRVGRSGWVQTPAFEFPLDSHSRLPFFHWFGQPIRAGALRLRERFRTLDVDRRRAYIDYTTHLSYGEISYLFPDAIIFVERYLGLPKSYVVHWTGMKMTA